MQRTIHSYHSYIVRYRQEKINMNSIKYLIALSLMLYSCGSSQKPDSNRLKNDNEIVGTWQLIEFPDYDTTENIWIHPFGEKVKGYFTYTKNNIVNLNISNEESIILSPDSLSIVKYSYSDVLNNSLGYFGNYTIDFENSIVTHHVKGGSIPWYIGTDQQRPFILNGDTLIIGDNKTWKRILIKVD